MPIERFGSDPKCGHCELHRIGMYVIDGSWRHIAMNDSFVVHFFVNKTIQNGFGLSNRTKISVALYIRMSVWMKLSSRGLNSWANKPASILHTPTMRAEQICRKRSRKLVDAKQHQFSPFDDAVNLYVSAPRIRSTNDSFRSKHQLNSVGERFSWEILLINYIIDGCSSMETDSTEIIAIAFRIGCWCRLSALKITFNCNTQRFDVCLTQFWCSSESQGQFGFSCAAIAGTEW